MSDRQLAVIGAWKRFGTTEVLRGVDLMVAEGSLTAVLGPSGCGKTTLLRVIAGFETLDAGVIRVGDRELSSLPPEARSIGIVPQEGALFPHLDVRRNVAFGLGSLSKRDRRARMEECLAMVGLSGFEAARPSELSGGQQQRVAVARALAPRPAVLLLDEPFAALDANLRAHVREELAAAVRASGTTTVLVTHDQDEAFSLADQVAVVLAGRVLQVAAPQQLYRHPVNLAVGEFVGEADVLAAVNVDGVAATVFGSVAVEAPSGDVWLLVRPEQVVLAADGQPATVIDVKFFGHDCLAKLCFDDGTPAAVRVAGHRAPRTNDRVRVRIDGVVQGFAR